MSAGKQMRSHQNENIQKFINSYDHQQVDEEYVSKKLDELCEIVKALVLRELDGIDGIADKVSNQFFRGYRSSPNYFQIEYIVGTDLIDNITTIKRSFIGEYQQYDDFDLNRALKSSALDTDEESFYGKGYSNYIENMTVLGYARKVGLLSKPINPDEFNALLF